MDSWGWLALGDEKERRHLAARQCYSERRGVRGRIVTSDYVLDEVITHTFRRQPFPKAWLFLDTLRQSASDGFILIERVDEARFGRALELRRRFHDKPGISFTDLTSMVLMQELRIIDVLTADRHFEQVGLGFRLYP